MKIFQNIYLDHIFFEDILTANTFTTIFYKFPMDDILHLL